MWAERVWENFMLSLCYDLYLDVPPNPHALIGRAVQSWLDPGCVIRGLRVCGTLNQSTDQFSIALGMENGKAHLGIECTNQQVDSLDRIQRERGRAGLLAASCCSCLPCSELLLLCYAPVPCCAATESANYAHKPLQTVS